MHCWWHLRWLVTVADIRCQGGCALTAGSALIYHGGATAATLVVGVVVVVFW